MVAQMNDPRPGAPSASPSSAFAILGRLLGEGSSYFRYYIRVLLARLQLTLATVLLFAALGAAAGLAGLAIVVTAGVLLVCGIARLLAYALGGHIWAGDILTGVIILVGVIGGTYIGVKFATRGLRAGFKSALDEMRSHQRETYGTDVSERSEG